MRLEVTKPFKHIIVWDHQTNQKRFIYTTQYLKQTKLAAWLRILGATYDMVFGISEIKKILPTSKFIWVWEIFMKNIISKTSIWS